MEAPKIMCKTSGLVTCGIAMASLWASTPGRSESDVKFKPSMQGYFYGYSQKIAPSNINPDNAALKIEDRGFGLDLRPNLKAEMESFQFIAKPQFKHIVTSVVEGVRGPPSDRSRRLPGLRRMAYGLRAIKFY
jgi:hypothetical protein